MDWRKIREVRGRKRKGGKGKEKNGKGEEIGAKGRKGRRKFDQFQKSIYR